MTERTVQVAAERMIQEHQRCLYDCDAIQVARAVLDGRREVEGLRAVLEAKTLTITRAYAHLMSAGLHSSPTAYRDEVEAARQALETDSDETVYQLIGYARHLEWIAEEIARSEGDAGTQYGQTARICLERFRAARAALAPARDGAASSGGDA